MLVSKSFTCLYSRVTKAASFLSLHCLIGLSKISYLPTLLAFIIEYLLQHHTSLPVLRAFPGTLLT